MKWNRLKLHRKTENISLEQRTLRVVDGCNIFVVFTILKKVLGLSSVSVTEGYGIHWMKRKCHPIG